MSLRRFFAPLRPTPIVLVPLVGSLCFSSCASTQDATKPTAATAETTKEETVEATKPAAAKAPSNPLFAESILPFHFPRFDLIKDADFEPAFERGMADDLKEVEAIANQSEPASFENTFVAMQKSGQILSRTETIFDALISANTNETLEAVRTKMAPKLAAHQDAILLNAKLFARVKSVYDKRESLGLDAESLRLVELNYRDFIRAGANLNAADKEKLKAMNAELATLETQFSQNVLNEVNADAIIVDTRAELDGLNDEQIKAAEQEAIKRKLDGKFVIALLNTSGQPVLSALKNRKLRQRVMETSLARGSHGGANDNREVLSKTMRLRAERAQLLGYKDHASYGLETQTARTTDAVNARLALLAPAANANAKHELADLRKMARKDRVKHFGSWDWSYYTEKLRAKRFSFDAEQLRPYFEFNNVMTNGVFYAANRLYGITFKERHDLPVYQADVRVFDVFDADKTQLAIYIMDPYARASKRGGAWMNAYVTQSGLLDRKAVVANHLNITKPQKGEAALMTFDEVTTMFHEFGHALHGMFSNVRYPQLAGTNVPRDFVEYPSQVNEMWAVWPEVLAHYAKHYKTGEAMPKALLDKVLATQTFNQGFATTEYLEAAMLDQAWHQLAPSDVPAAKDVMAFEAKALKKAGFTVKQVPPRYRSPYFSHIFGGYDAGYYAYIWSEVLDADTVEWFKENGGLKRENGDHFRKTLLSRGNTEDAMKVFVEFRGKEPAIEPLLKRRGLSLPKKH